MSEAQTADLFDLQDSYAREIPELSVAFRSDDVPEPELVVVNEGLAAELGLDPSALAGPEVASVLTGSVAPDGPETVALAYAGHQFGAYSPLLGDGRAVLLGEITGADGRRRDVHLKGSGRTPFARGGDGKATVGPMLREYLIAEAMAALGIPTTRALAVATTGETIWRDRAEPGAVLTRVAASHLRVGTFELALRLRDREVLPRLADYAIARHHPEASGADEPYLALLEAVRDAQAELIAQWMLVGFIHGVMNTDNMTISGEGIDYGPCAFMNGYDPATVFSSIDHDGRYAFGNQPRIAVWNLSRFAETLLPLINGDQDEAVAQATTVLEGFMPRFEARWRTGMEAKLGLDEVSLTAADREQLIDDYLGLLEAGSVDYTQSFRALAARLRGDGASVPEVFGGRDAIEAWAVDWQSHLGRSDTPVAEIAVRMDACNPVHVPRNHLVEEALEAATVGELDPFHALLDVVTDPYRERPGQTRFASPPPEGFEDTFQTFCGT